MHPLKPSADDEITGYGNPATAPLGLEGLIEPDDQGLSLDELSQAYVALLGKGADPYRSEALNKSADALPVEIADVIKAPLENDREPQPVDGEVSPQSILEAMLFVGHPTGEPLTSERIASFMRGVLPAEIDDLVRELNADYAGAEAPYLIISDGPGYRLEIRPEFAGLRESFYGRIREARLSQAAVDVLAIVGYHQPMTLEQIDRLRGKSSGGIVTQLVRRDLLSLCRSAGEKSKGHYKTTGRFLSLFGLEELSQLPRGPDFERP